MQVADKMVVSIRYIMKNSKGEVLENTMDGEAVKYLHGAGSILPSLESDLLGMKAGEERTLFISNEQGYTEVDDTYSFRVMVDHVRLATDEELRMGGPLPNDKEECGTGCCC